MSSLRVPDNYSAWETRQMNLSLTKPTKWPMCPAKTHIIMGTRTVWSESSLCAQWLTFAARIGDKYQIRLTRSMFNLNLGFPLLLFYFMPSLLVCVPSRMVSGKGYGNRLYRFLIIACSFTYPFLFNPPRLCQSNDMVHCYCECSCLWYGTGEDATRNLFCLDRVVIIPKYFSRLHWK